MGLKWFRAVEYCNWLSEQEGIPKDQWCFEPNKQGRYGAGMIVKPNFLELSGYRLPTESEWEFACRAGTNTSRYYGQTEELLKHYAWYLNNSQHQARPVGLLKPNDFGLFDMLGNSWEWCFDKKWNYPVNSSHITEDIPQFDSITTWVMERVHRGGALHSRTGIVRSANRSFYLPSTIYGQLGFRVARTLPQVDTASSPKKNEP
jgi:hypothetical protein